MQAPEINLAARLVRLKRLTPPIDVSNLAKEYASVHKVVFPVQIDGVCLDLKQRGKKPRILVNANLPPRRLRFTLAHELGHVIIPWHVGSIVDETEESRIDLSLFYWQLEGEANRFASELLMPSEWAADLIGRSDNPIDAANLISARADVSFAATIIKVQTLLPKGYLFAKIVDDELIYSSKSEGTLASMPRVIGETQINDLFPHAANHWTKSNGPEKYHIWQFKNEVPIAPSRREWRELLDEICRDIMVPESERKSFKQRVMAVIANANGRIREDRTPESVNSACIQRLHASAGSIRYLEKFIQSPKLSELLAAKIAEFFRQTP